MTHLTAARAQMALSLIFHIVFAAIGIGLPLLMVLTEYLHLRTREPHYLALTRQWAKATGLLFAVGAVSGTALSFELGLLFPRYTAVMGPAVGHLFALEGFAFFIEAIFIGLFLYGWDKLSPRTHWLCGVVVAVSGAASGILVLGVNAWMQVPVGFTLDANGAVTGANPFAIFHQPAWAYMAVHSTLSCYIAVPFAAAAIYARGYLKGRRDAYHRSAIRLCLAVGAVAAVLQPLSGDLLAKFVFRTQPAKFAAMEGQFATQSYAPLRIGGIPDTSTGQTRYALEIPGGLSFLATHHPGSVVPGLDAIPRDRWPNVDLTHFSFQVMVGAGTALLLLSAWFWFATWRHKDRALDGTRKLLPRAIVLAGPLGFLALEAGWMITEIGRQPWAIQHVLLTADAATPAAAVRPVFFSFAVLYLLLGAMVVYLLNALRGGPESVPAPQAVPGLS